jgi:DNA-binding transcriptional LysR family regulator
MVMDQLRSKKLQRVLEPYAPTVPGFFLCFPSRPQRSAPLRLFVEVVKELAVRGLK